MGLLSSSKKNAASASRDIEQAFQVFGAFLKRSKREGVGLEFISKERVLLHVAHLNHAPLLDEGLKRLQSKYRNGFFLYLMFEEENIEADPHYQKYLASGLEMEEFRIQGLVPMRLIASAFPRPKDGFALGKRLLETSNAIYHFERPPMFGWQMFNLDEPGIFSPDYWTNGCRLGLRLPWGRLKGLRHQFRAIGSWAAFPLKGLSRFRSYRKA